MAQTLSDGELVARCRSGDQQAWAELVDRFSRYVYAISVQAFRLPEADAEDVFQEVFARAYEHLDRLRDDGAVRPWLAQLTRRLCIDRLRAASRERPTADEELDSTGSEETLTMRAPVIGNCGASPGEAPSRTVAIASNAKGDSNSPPMQQDHRTEPGNL